jgi:acyl-CoA synthetase (AMP-forming)/AMP-acid ligase II
MKPLFLIAGGMAMLPALQANPVIRDAATHEQLAAQLQKADQSDPLKMLATSGSTGKPAPIPVQQPESLMSRSDVLSFGGNGALVPKRAILHIPEKYKTRLGIESSPRLVSWSEFYSVNRGWITTYEVTRAQASGREPLGEALLSQIGKGSNVIIATFMGGPISVLPLKEAEETTTQLN